uniref:Uncharacterized protein n=1 Tax=Steinernema glaseri TaxID=37863 RepID=A0A1I7ZE45_9BILA
MRPCCGPMSAMTYLNGISSQLLPVYHFAPNAVQRNKGRGSSSIVLIYHRLAFIGMREEAILVHDFDVLSRCCHLVLFDHLVSTVWFGVLNGNRISGDDPFGFWPGVAKEKRGGKSQPALRSDHTVTAPIFGYLSEVGSECEVLLTRSTNMCTRQQPSPMGVAGNVDMHFLLVGV